MSVKVIMIRENEKRRVKMVECEGMKKKEKRNFILKEMGIVNEDDFVIGRSRETVKPNRAHLYLKNK